MTILFSDQETTGSGRTRVPNVWHRHDPEWSAGRR